MYESSEASQSIKRSSTTLKDTYEHEIIKKTKFVDERWLDDSEIWTGGLKLSEHGIIFQLKLLMLCLWRAAHTTENNQKKYKAFRLATEMLGAEKFDDIVFQYWDNESDKWKFRLLQAKHKEQKSLQEALPTITLNNLLSSDDVEPFSLQKYFHSYVKVEQRCQQNSIYSIFSNSDIEDIVVITNTDLDKNARNIFNSIGNIKEDYILATDKKDTYIHQRDTKKEENEIHKKLKIIFENTADFYKLTEALAILVVKGEKLDKNSSIFKEYYFPLIQNVFQYDGKCDGENNDHFINLDNFINKKDVKGITLNKDLTMIRDALIKEISFRQYGICINVRIDKHFGNRELPRDDKLLCELAQNLGKVILSDRKVKKCDFKHYHAAIGNLLDFRNKKFRQSFLKVPEKSKHSNNPFLGKFKLHLKNYLKHHSNIKKITNDYLKKIRFQKISSAFQTGELPCDNKKLLVTAQKLTEYICNNKKLVVEDFPNHFALAKEVIDIRNGKFLRTFLEGDTNLSPEAKKFRRFFFDEAFIKIKIDNERHSIKEIGENFIKANNRIRVSQGFIENMVPEIEIKIENIDLFSQQMKTLLDYYYRNEQNVIEINDSLKALLSINDDGYKEFSHNIKKLAYFVLINRFDKICFSTAFLKSDNLPRDLHKLRTNLKELLGYDQFESLHEFKFIIKGFKTCEDGEMFRKLPFLFDNDLVDKFFSKLKFVVNYPNRIEISDLLGEEIRDELKKLDSQAFQSLYFKTLYNWMADRVGTFYTAGKTSFLFSQITYNLSLCTIDGFNYPYFASVSNKYIFREYTLLNTFLLDNSKQVLHLVFKDLVLGRTRVVQTFLQLKKGKSDNIKKYIHDFGHIFLSLSQLNDAVFYTEISKAFEDKYKFNLIVIDCDMQNQNAQIIEKLSNVMINNKKLIFITTEPFELPKYFSPGEISTDSTGIDDLQDEQSKNNLLQEQAIIFQGHQNKIKLADIIGIYDLDDFLTSHEGMLQEIISSDTLIKFIKGEEIKVGNAVEGLGEILSYYIHRNFYRLSVKKEIQQDEKFDNILYYELEEFESFCKKNPLEKVHLLVEVDGKLVWECSQNSISELRKYVEIDKNGLCYPESAFMEKISQRKVVIITGTGGMGKSTVLASFAEAIKNLSPHEWVVRINLNNFSAALAKEQKQREKHNPSFTPDDDKKTINFLLEMLNSNEKSQLKHDLEYHLFKYAFNCTKKITLLFDGFDEIVDYKNVVFDLLSGLKATKVKQLWVTTRPNMRKELEDKLETLAYEIKPFSKPQDQIDFLTKFWKKGLEEELILNNQRLSVYTSAVVKLLSQMTAMNEVEFSCIPLHTMMVGASFYEYTPQGRMLWQGCKDFLRDNNEEPVLPQREFGILDLYDHFIWQKYILHYRNRMKMDLNISGVRRLLEAEFLNFKQYHTKLAFYTMVRGKTLPILPLSKRKIIESLIRSIKPGTIEHDKTIDIGFIDQIIGDKPHFIHHNFTEYFAAFFVSEKLLKTPSNTLRSLNYLLYKTSSLFINFIIKSLDGKQQNISLLLEKPLLEFITNTTYFNLMKFLLKYGFKDWHRKLDAFDKTFLHYAAECGNLNIVNTILNYVNDTLEETIMKHGNFINSDYKNSKLVHFININDKFDKTALNYAVEKNNMEVAFGLLLKGASLASLIDTEIEGLAWYMLKKESTSIYNSGILGVYADQDNEFRPIQELILARVPAIFKQLNRQYQSRLLSYFLNNGRVEIIKKLLYEVDSIDTRIEILNSDDNGFTALDRVNASDLLSDDKRLAITEYLLKNGANKTDFFLGYTASMDEYCKSKRTIYTQILHAASRCNHLKTFKYYINKEHNELYKYHIFEALNYGQFDIVKYLLTKYNADDGNTVLHHAASYKSNLRNVKFLINNGENINAENDKGETPLFEALKVQCTLRLVQYFVANGADFNKQNNYGQAPLYYALHFHLYEVGKYLLELGAEPGEKSDEVTMNKIGYFSNSNEFNLDFVDEKGFSRLHNAILSDNFEWSRFILDNGGSVNIKDKNGQTPLHLAVKRGSVKIFHLLLWYRAIFDARDNDNLTPLQLAANKSDKKITWLLNTINKLFNSENLIDDLRKSSLILGIPYWGRWGPYGEGYTDVSDGNNPMRYIINVQNSSDRTLLHIAATTDKLSEASGVLLRYNREYIERKKEQTAWLEDKSFPFISSEIDYQNLLIDSIDKDGNTPLHIAAQKGNARLVEIFLEEGATFNCKNNAGHTPKQLAETEKYTDIVRILDLIEHIFCLAENQSESQDFNEFSKLPVTFVNTRNKCGKTLLHILSSNNNTEAFTFLSEKCNTKINFNSLDFERNTPLHFMVKANNFNMIKYILLKGAYFDIKNNQGKAPFERESNESSKFLSSLNQLFDCVQSDTPELLGKLLRYVQHKFNVDTNIIINSHDKRGNTLLHYAAKNHYLDLVKFLLKKGAIFNLENEAKKTPVTYDNPEIKSLLKLIQEMFNDLCHVYTQIDEQILANVRNQDGFTLLQHAFNKDCIGMCIKLIKCGANISLLNKAQVQKILTFAKNEGFMEIVDLIEELSSEYVSS